MALLEIKGLKKNFGDLKVLKDVNMKIEEGEVLVLIGPSGSGKSTFLRCLNLLEQPTGGEILFKGKNILAPKFNIVDYRKHVGMCFQRFNLFPFMTVLENVMYSPVHILKKDKNEMKEKAMVLLDKVGLANKANVYPDTLSGGQQQRVELARAIVLEPKILCLDEPLSNLDAKLRIDMRMELKRLQKELGITTLYVTHDQEEALTLSDRIAVFNNGYVEQVGTPYEIYNESKSEFVCDFIGDINRLKGELLSEVNTQSGANLDTNKTGFVRIERCISEEKAGYVKLTGKVEEAEFSGVLTKYVLECHGQELKYLEKNDGRRLYQENEQIDLYINPQDIMQF